MSSEFVKLNVVRDCQHCDKNGLYSNDATNGRKIKVTKKNVDEKKTVVTYSSEATNRTKYPYSVFFIVSNEFCERFCFYGMRSILTLYLVNILLYSKADATVIYHTFITMVYFFPLIGAIISDSFLGKFRTIFYVSIIYAAGSIILAISSIPSLNLPMRTTSIFGLALIAIGTGGIKPCVSAFGGDQFVLPEQAALLAMFFSLFYFSINAGSLLSTFLTPILREEHCFGNTSCYPLAFGVPGVLMIVAIAIFGLGRPLYTIKKPEGNIVLKVMKCIGYGLKMKASSNEKKDHWLDHSVKKYGQHFVNDIKAALKVLVMYLPLPIFWALYDQQGTAWTFQATRMDGDIGFYTILPDQFQLINPLLILVFIPIFQYIIYPIVEKIGLLRTPLAKMTCGGFLAALAFGVSAFVSIQIESTDPVLPSEGFAQIRFYNPLPCDINIIKTEPCNLKDDLNGILKPMDYIDILDFKIKNSSIQRIITINYEAECMKEKSKETSFPIESQSTKLAYFTYDGLISVGDNITKDDDTGSPYLRILMSKSPSARPYYISLVSDDTGLETINNTFTERVKMSAGSYRVIRTERIESNKSNETNTHLMDLAKIVNNIGINLRLGGVYTLMIQIGESDDLMTGKLITVTKPNSISMLWLLPQYFIITAAEILFSITGLEFSYSQAPVSMKSVLTAAFLLTDSFGNLLVVVIEALKFSDRASIDFFFYTGLMVADMLIFWYLAQNYKYVNFEESEDQMKLDNDNNFLQSKQDMCVENPVFAKNQDD